jgi:hypothetical protein
MRILASRLGSNSTRMRPDGFVYKLEEQNRTVAYIPGVLNLFQTEVQIHTGLPSCGPQCYK